MIMIYFPILPPGGDAFTCTSATILVSQRFRSNETVSVQENDHTVNMFNEAPYYGTVMEINVAVTVVLHYGGCWFSKNTIGLCL